MEYGFRSCVYLDNPSSLAGCGLVNSLVEDSQKSKSASDIFNALDGLGFITRQGSIATITELGLRFIEADRSSFEWQEIAKIGTQNYGPFAGLVFLASLLPRNQAWVRKQITLGFSETGEEVDFQGELVTLSTGSQDDTITRSRSSIITWGVATGFFIPRASEGLVGDGAIPPQVTFKDYLMGPKWRDGFFNSDLVYTPNTSIVERPLSYNQLVKSIRSLRENGQEAQRQASLRWETVIKNRRLAIAYALHQSASIGKPLVFREFIDALSRMPDFVISQEDLEQTMVSELGNAFVIGTPYRLVSQDLLQGIRSVNLEVLSSGADPRIKDQLLTLTAKSALFGD